MPSEERREALLHMLEKDESASIRELAARLFVSEASVRRDVAALEDEGLVRRIHGGVLLASCEHTVIPLSLRDGEHSAQKEQLARRAAQLVQDGDTLLMDASSTVRRMIKYLSGRKNLTILTNNDRLFAEMGTLDARMFCTGGEYVRENHAFAGPAAENAVRSFWADKVFFSSQGLSADGEVSDHSEAENSLRRVMLERAEQKICLMDASKLGCKCTFRLCGREEVDLFLCNVTLPWEKKGASQQNDQEHSPQG